MRDSGLQRTKVFLLALILLLGGCAGSKKADVFHDPEMDFGAIKTIAVMPLSNLTSLPAASARVRDVFMARLLETGGIYVLPPGEVARGITRAGIVEPTAPSPEEVVKLCGIIKADAVITGVLREYGEMRSGATSANVIAIGMQMIEGQTGKIVWSASATEGGVSLKDRLLGPSGEPVNDVTVEAVDDIINKLFQ